MKKFDRFVISELSVSDLYDLLSNDNYDLCLCVYAADFETRYVIPKFNNYSEYINYLKIGNIQKFDHGVDSSSFSLYSCDYIDCYIKNPI